MYMYMMEAEVLLMFFISYSCPCVLGLTCTSIYVPHACSTQGPEGVGSPGAALQTL